MIFKQSKAVDHFFGILGILTVFTIFQIFGILRILSKSGIPTEKLKSEEMKKSGIFMQYRKITSGPRDIEISASW